MRIPNPKVEAEDKTDGPVTCKDLVVYNMVASELLNGIIIVCSITW